MQKLTYAIIIERKIHCEISDIVCIFSTVVRYRIATCIMMANYLVNSIIDSYIEIKLTISSAPCFPNTTLMFVFIKVEMYHLLTENDLKQDD